MDYTILNLLILKKSNFSHYNFALFQLWMLIDTPSTLAPNIGPPYELETVSPEVLEDPDNAKVEVGPSTSN